MDIIMVILVSMCLLCAAIGLFAGVRNSAEARRAAIRKTTRHPLALVAVLCFLLGCVPLEAQEVIHAQAGKVIAVNPAAKTLVLKQADGSTTTFKDVPSHEPALSLDKSMRDKTVPVAGYSKVGSNVVVLYYGFDAPTAVAIKELGAGSPAMKSGSVTGFDRHDHSLTLKTAAAEPQKLVLTEDTIVDTSDGVVKLADYKPSKGEQLRCLTSPASETALLVLPQ